MKLFPLALCVNKFTHINIVDFFITRSITSNKFVLSSLNQEIRLLAIFNGSSIENHYSTRLFIAKGNSPPKAEGQRWEAQRAAKQCLETGSMMFECSEFLLPQALRQAASGEVWTDWRILQQLMLMQFVNLLCKSTTLAAYSRAQCWRSLHRTGCEKTMLSTFSTECCTRLPSSLVL